MFIKYGKPMGDILKLKESFFKENEKYLKLSEDIKAVYTEQRKRTSCVICSSTLPDTFYIESHGLKYFLCDVCKHINGEFRVDGTFYAQHDNVVLTDNYKSLSIDDYRRRMISVYMPKAQFLLDSFDYNKIYYQDYKYLDIGAGSGYFVAALRELNLNASGVEISEAQVNHGNTMLGIDVLKLVQPSKVADEIMNTECQVISFFGVLTLLENIHSFFEAAISNKNIEYIIFNMQMFSLGIIIESVFPEVYNRQLGGPLTHLFSNESFELLCSRYNLNLLSKWSFGTDIMDLYRSLWVMSGNSGTQLQNDISDFFIKYTDDIQLVIDKTPLTGEITVLVKINR